MRVTIFYGGQGYRFTDHKTTITTCLKERKGREGGGKSQEEKVARGITNEVEIEIEDK